LKKELAAIPGKKHYVDQNHIKLSQDACCVHIPSGATQALVEERTGILLPAKALQYIGQLTSVSKFGETESAADALLRYVRETEGVSYIALFDEPDSDLHTFTRPRGYRRFLREGRQSSGETMLGNEDIDFNINPSLIDFGKWVEDRRHALQVSEKKKMLLALAWTTDEQRRLFHLFPEVTAADTTEKTNNTKRALFLWCGKTSYNKSFTAMQSFIPCQSRFVFQWIFGTAAPTFFNTEALDRNRFNITDGDEKLFGAFDDLIREGIYKNSVSGLCYWHLVERDELRKILSPVTRSDDEYFVIKVTKRWIKSWFYSLETHDEFNDSQSHFLKWIKWDRFNEALGSTKQRQLLTFLTKKLYPWKARWLRANLLDTTTLDTHASGIVEAENRVLKRHATGARPNQSLKNSAEAMTKLNVRRTNLSKKRVATSLDATYVDRDNGDDDNDDNDDDEHDDDDEDGTSTEADEAAAANVAGEEPRFAYMDEIVHYCNQRVKKEYKCSSRLHVHKVNDKLYYVKAPDAKLRYNEESDWQYWVPQYCRTREVKVIEYKGRRCLLCSCKFPKRHQRPCLHQWAVLKRHPRPTDIPIRWHKIYYHFGYRDKQITELLIKLRNDALPGPEFDNEDVNDYSTAIGIEYFVATLPSMGPVLRASNHWLTTEGIIPEETDLENSLALSQQVGLSQAAFADTNDFAMNRNEDDFDDVHSFASDNQEKVHQVSAYQRAQPFMQDITKYAETSDAAADLMVDMLSRVLQEMEAFVSSESGENVVAGEIAFPALLIDKQKNAKRLKPYYSPTKTKKK
jgi:hypothetical protein